MASAFKEARGPWIEAGGSTAAIAFDGWWQGYGDPELDALQRRLIENSPDLASALARYQQAKAVTDSLRAAQSPTLNTSLKVTDLRAVIDLEERAQMLCGRGPDFEEAMKAFLEKRPPGFSGK